MKNEKRVQKNECEEEGRRCDKTLKFLGACPVLPPGGAAFDGAVGSHLWCPRQQHHLGSEQQVFLEF